MKKGDGSTLHQNYNHGKESSKGERGQKMCQSYGKDGSSYVGSSAKERGQGMGGSTSNLSHSLGGTSAKQRGN